MSRNNSGRTLASRAPSSISVGEADRVKRPTGNDIRPTDVQYDDSGEFVITRTGGHRVYVGVGCRHMAIGRGETPTKMCHIPQCKTNERAMRASAADAAQTPDDTEG